MEEGYPDRAQQRGIYPGYEVLQPFAEPFELKTSESEEDDACWRHWASAYMVGEGSGGFESNAERFEVG
jgi:hypothetical protein